MLKVAFIFIAALVAMPALAMDKEDEGELRVSDNPGAYEAHLIRRYRSPYFDDNRRKITAADLDRARQKDREQFDIVVARYNAVIAKLDDLPDNATTGMLMPIREELEDDVIAFANGVGGLALEIAKRGDRVRSGLIDAIRDAVSNDPEALENLRIANEYYDNVIRIRDSTIFAPIVINAIPSEDVFATILNETPDAMDSFLGLLPEETASEIALNCLRLLLAKQKEGVQDDNAVQKAKILAAIIKQK